MSNHLNTTTSIFFTSLDENGTGHSTTYGNEASSAMVDTEPLRVFGLVIGIFAIIVGSIGNLLTIAAIKTNKKLHKPFYIFIGNLSVIDFLTATSMLPFNVASYYQRAWPFGNDDITCTLMAAWYYNCGYTSIVCLVVITVNRYIGIVWPNKYDILFTKRRVALTIAISWLFAPIFLIPSFFFGSAHGFGWGSYITLCVFLTNDYTRNQLNYMQFTRALFQILPVVVMIVLYSLIFQKSKRSFRRITKFSKDTKRNSTKVNSLKKHISLASPKLAKMFWGSNTPQNEPNVKDDLELPGSYKMTKQQKENGGVISKQKNDGVFLEKETDDPLSNDYEINRNKDLSLQSIPTSEETNMKRCYLTLSKESGHEQESKLRTVCGSEKFTDHHDQANHRPLASRLSTASSFSSSGKKKQKSRPLSNGHSHRKKMDRRLLRVSVTICVFFMILFLPSVIINFTSYRNWRIYPRINMGASVITWLNACVNPLVYCFINATMRKQYKLLLKKASNLLCRRRKYY